MFNFVLSDKGNVLKHDLLFISLERSVFEFETESGRIFKLPFYSSLSNEEPTSKWYQTLSKKTIMKEIVDKNDKFTLGIPFNYIPKK